MRFSKVLSPFVVVLFTSLPVEAGWVIADKDGHQTLLSRGRLKMAPREVKGVSMALDIGQARMWVADAGHETYWEGTVEEYCQGMRSTMASALADMEKQMAEAMKDMPPAQREQMQQMLKSMRGEATPGPAPRVTVEKTNEVETIAGLSARKFRVLSDGKLYEDVWLTKDPALLREVEISKAPDTFGRMSGCMAGVAGGARPEGSDEFRTLYGEGWPLKVVYYGGGDTGRGPTGSTVTTVEQRDIPDREFTPPAGFRPASLSEVFGTAPRR